MTNPNYSETYRQVHERFANTLETEHLNLEGLLSAHKLLERHRDEVATLSHEAYDFPSLEHARNWADGCVENQIALRALALTDHEHKLVGFTWASHLSVAGDINVEGDSKAVIDLETRYRVSLENSLYASALIISPEYRRKGLGLGLAVTALKMYRDEHPHEGSLLFYRTHPNNGAAAHISQELGAEHSNLVDTLHGNTIWYAYVPPVSTT